MILRELLYYKLGHRFHAHWLNIGVEVSLFYYKNELSRGAVFTSCMEYANNIN